MELPYVWLADIPEADRETLLHRLAKGLGTAEGLPATLPSWVQKVPVWELGGQPQRPLAYAEQAHPNSMQSYQISVDYWLEALHGRVDVAFGQNAVFWGHEGYLHVRVLQHDDSITSTGMPGRPSKAKHLIDAEFERRVAADECEPSLAGEVRALLHWVRVHYPHVAPPNQKTVENNIRLRYAGRKAVLAQRPTK
jgi:hypothetical protein